MTVRFVDSFFLTVQNLPGQEKTLKKPLLMKGMVQSSLLFTLKNYVLLYFGYKWVIGIAHFKSNNKSERHISQNSPKNNKTHKQNQNEF